MNKLSLLGLLSVLAFVGCLDRYKLDTRDFTPKLIIEGQVSNMAGPYTVRIAKSTHFGDKEPNTEVQATSVDIIEKSTAAGERVIKLVEQTTGLFQTPLAFRGTVGYVYQLRIRMPDGKEYLSRPETIQKPVPVDTVVMRYVGGPTKSAFNIAVRSTDPTERGNYYRWNVIHFDTIGICKTRTLKNQGGTTIFLHPCCTQPCWERRSCLGCVNISEDGLYNGKSYEWTIGTAPYYFYRPYFVHIEQQSISQAHYLFWKIAQTQITNSGGIFDNPPAQVPGNLYNTKDSTEQVLGFFAAVGTTLKPVYLSRQGIRREPFEPPIHPSAALVYVQPCEPCQGVNRQTFPPLGW